MVEHRKQRELGRRRASEAGAVAETDTVGRRDARRQLRGLAWLLDSSIPVPGTRYRIGVDPLLGLIPGFGDLLGLGISSYILITAAQLGASRSVVLRMAGNVLVDSMFGVVPVLGDLFDAAWKANERNVRLLERYVERPTRVQQTSRLWVAGVVAAVAFVALVLLLLGWIFLRWLFTTAF